MSRVKIVTSRGRSSCSKEKRFQFMKYLQDLSLQRAASTSVSSSLSTSLRSLDRALIVQKYSTWFTYMDSGYVSKPKRRAQTLSNKMMPHEQSGRHHWKKVGNLKTDTTQLLRCNYGKFAKAAAVRQADSFCLLESYIVVNAARRRGETQLRNGPVLVGGTLP